MKKPRIHFYNSHARRSRMTGKWRQLYSALGANPPFWSDADSCRNYARLAGCVAVFHGTKREALDADFQTQAHEVFG